MSPLKVGFRKKLNVLIFALMAVEGLAALATLFSVRSESGSAFLFGYSLARLVIAGVVILAVSVLGVCAASALMQPSWWQHLSRGAIKVMNFLGLLFALAFLFSIFLAILVFLLLTLAAGEQELVTQRAIVERAGFVFLWIECCILQFGLLIALNKPRADTQRRLCAPLGWSILLAFTIIVYDIVLYTYATTSWKILIRGHEVIFLPAVLGLLYGAHNQFFHTTRWFKTVNHLLLLAFIGVSTYAVYQHTILWVKNDYTSSKAYWHLLADAFLQGRLYLENPASTHDLTFYNGRWYVPVPPLPAFIVMPFVALIGVEKINMVRFSIFIGAINAVLLFQVLAMSSSLKLIPTRRAGNLLLIAVAILGTSHWWLAIKGQMWFISQLLTLTFTTLAAMLVLLKASPWLAGLSLGIAVLSRPNSFTLWPFLVGLKLYLDSPTGKEFPEWKAFFAWAIRSALPVCLAVAGLLYYNFIRFDNWLDFGYVTIHGADRIVEAVRTYGMFNVHFVPANFYVMFMKLPRIELEGGCFYFSPTREGISILATTPAVIYLIRRFKLNWWTAGAWASIVLSSGLLLFYHNTGSWQMGYRYLMDFLLPVLLLMGLGIGKRPSWIFIALTLLSILVNTAGIYWWFTEWWCKPT